MSHILLIEAKDVQPLEDFLYQWRWTDPRYNVLPREALGSIQPLTAQKSQEIWKYAAKFTGETKYSGEIDLSHTLFSSITRIATSGDVEAVRRWLTEQVSETYQQVFVTWEPSATVIVDWQVFCQYWDDFCYPSSDDNLIWPMSEDWALAYWHEEEFLFGVKDTSIPLLNMP